MPGQVSRIPVVVAPVHVNGVTISREMARKGTRVVGIGPSADAAGLQTRFLAERVVLPPPEEEPGEFASFLLARKDLYGGIVIPTDDFHLREIADSYGDLSGRYKLAVAPPDATRIALDKALTYTACAQAGVACPKTRALDDGRSTSLEAPSLSRGSDLDEAAEFVGFPAILRPAFSIAFYRDFGTKSFQVGSAGQLGEMLGKARSAGHKMLLQEIIPGGDENVVSCKVYATDSGDILGALAGFKLAIYPPGFGVSQMQETRPAGEVEEGTRRILRQIGFRGSLASVEWKLDPRDGVWKMLEINARSVMAIALMKYSGSDVIDMLWRDKLGLPQLPPTRPKYQRRWAYIKNGFLLYKKYPGERKGLREYMRLYRPPMCFALLDLTDMKPFLYDIAPLFVRRLGGQVK